jgi:hypothetical protein
MYNNYCEKNDTKFKERGNTQTLAADEKVSIMRQFNLENIDADVTPKYHSRKVSQQMSSINCTIDNEYTGSLDQRVKDVYLKEKSNKRECLGETIEQEMSRLSNYESVGAVNSNIGKSYSRSNSNEPIESKAGQFKMTSVSILPTHTPTLSKESIQVEESRRAAQSNILLRAAQQSITKSSSKG